MEDIYLLIGGLLLLLGQVVCLFAKKVWVRLIPVVIVTALMVFCIVMYAADGFTNWAYLILLFLLAGLLLAMGLLWLGYGIAWGIRKLIK